MTAMRVLRDDDIVTMTRDQANGIYNALTRYHGLYSSRFGYDGDEFYLLAKLRRNLKARVDLATPAAQGKEEPDPNQRASNDDDVTVTMSRAAALAAHLACSNYTPAQMIGMPEQMEAVCAIFQVIKGRPNLEDALAERAKRELLPQLTLDQLAYAHRAVVYYLHSEHYPDREFVLSKLEHMSKVRRQKNPMEVVRNPVVADDVSPKHDEKKPIDDFNTRDIHQRRRDVGSDGMGPRTDLDMALLYLQQHMKRTQGGS